VLAEEAPKVTDWMQAWGSLAGLLMSTVAVLFTGLLFRHEVRVRREERRDAEAAQARLVLAVRIGPQPPRDSPPAPPFRVGYRVLNFSGAPVLDVLVRYVWAGGSVGPTHHLPVLVGEERGELPVPAGLDPEVTGALADFSAIEIIFTDASGQKWQRVDRSAPVRLVERQYRDPGALTVAAVVAGIMLAAFVAGLGLRLAVH
jgi:hypothetical protein